MNVYEMKISSGEKAALKKLENIISELDIKVRCQLCPDFNKAFFDDLNERGWHSGLIELCRDIIEH